MTDTEVKAIILSSKDVGENDKLVRIFSLENGIIDIKLVGVKKPNAKLKVFKEPFCFAEFSLVQKGAFFIVTSANLLDSFHEISTDVDVFFSACEMVKLVEKTNPKGTKNPVVFIEFLRALKALAYDKAPPRTALLKFMLILLEKMGYSLMFTQCVSCGQKFVKAYLNLQTGEVICGDCKRNIPLLYSNISELSPLALSAMRLTEQTDYEKLSSLKLQPAGVEEGILLIQKNLLAKQ